jgi:hypothetical protein
MLVLPFPVDTLFIPWVLALTVIGLACALRAARMRVELSNGELTVVNLFRTVRLRTDSVKSAGFAATKWDGFPVPLVLVGDGVAVRASGVSVWTRQWKWPDQPFVRGKRSLARVQQFFEGSGITFDPRQPVRRLPGFRAVR